MINRYFASPFPEEPGAPGVPQFGPQSSVSGTVMAPIGPQQGPFSTQSVEDQWRQLMLDQAQRREAESQALAQAQRDLGAVKYEDPKRERVDPKTKAWVLGLSGLSALFGNKRAGEHAQGILGARKGALDERYADQVKASQTDYDNRLRQAIANVEAGKTLTDAERDAYQRAFGQLSFAGQRQGELFGQGLDTKRVGLAEEGLKLDERQVALAEKKWAEEAKPAWQRNYEAIRSQFPNLPEAQARGMALAQLVEGYDLNRYNAELRPILIREAKQQLGLNDQKAQQMELDIRLGKKHLQWFDRETQARINSAIASAYAAQSGAARGNALHPYEVWQVQYGAYYDTNVRPLLLQLDATYDEATKRQLAEQIANALRGAPKPETPVGPGQQGPPSPGLAPFNPFGPGAGLTGQIGR